MDIDIDKANALIGAHLRAERAKQGDMSRAELSELSGVPVITIRRIEYGERTAQTLTLVALCQALGISFAAFAEGFERELEKLRKPEASK